MSYQERALAIIDRLTDSKAINIRERGTLRRAILLPERPQGEWVFLKANEEQTDGYECSVCKCTYHTRVPYFSEFNFCPNCGADMKGGAE